MLQQEPQILKTLFCYKGAVQFLPYIFHKLFSSRRNFLDIQRPWNHPISRMLPAPPVLMVTKCKAWFLFFFHQRKEAFGQNMWFKGAVSNLVKTVSLRTFRGFVSLPWKLNLSRKAFSCPGNQHPTKNQCWVNEKCFFHVFRLAETASHIKGTRDVYKLQYGLCCHNLSMTKKKKGRKAGSHTAGKMRSVSFWKLPVRYAYITSSCILKNKIELEAARKGKKNTLLCKAAVWKYKWWVVFPS